MKRILTEAEYRAAMAEVQAIYDLLSTVPNIIGPAYGAAMCDRAGKVNNLLHPLALGLEDAAYSHDFHIERADWAPFKQPIAAAQQDIPPNVGIGPARSWYYGDFACA